MRENHGLTRRHGAISTAFEQNDPMAPYKELYLYIVVQALKDATTNLKNYKHESEQIHAELIQRQALRWLFEDDLCCVVTFADCCSALNIDPDAARAKMLPTTAAKRLPWGEP